MDYTGADGMTVVVKKNSKVRKRKEDKQERFIDFLDDAKQAKFTGYLKINFSQGQIGRIEKFEEILKS